MVVLYYTVCKILYIFLEDSLIYRNLITFILVNYVFLLQSAEYLSKLQHNYIERKASCQVHGCHHVHVRHHVRHVHHDVHVPNHIHHVGHHALPSCSCPQSCSLCRPSEFMSPIMFIMLAILLGSILCSGPTIILMLQHGTGKFGYISLY